MDFPGKWRAKLKSDGAYLVRLGSASVGVVIRDDQGQFQGGVKMPIYHGSVLLAEVWALKLELTLARKLGCTQLIVETDSKVSMVADDGATGSICSRFSMVGYLVSFV